MTANGELRDFLRDRREAVHPADVGLPVSGRRRVAGLRREEVATLANISVDYYVRLEQGRASSPSADVIGAVARALQLNRAQHDHLVALVNAGGSDAPISSDQTTRRAMQGFVDWLPVAAHVSGIGTVALASNALWDFIWSDLRAEVGTHRFFVRWIFLDPRAKLVHCDDWDEIASIMVGVLRGAVTTHPSDGIVRELIRDLNACSADFSALWSRQDVNHLGAFSVGKRRYWHEAVGHLELFLEVTEVDDDQWLYMLWPERGSPSEKAFERLRTLSLEALPGH